MVTFDLSNLLKPVVTGPRKSSGYMSALLSDSDWEADVLPLNYTRQFAITRQILLFRFVLGHAELRGGMRHYRSRPYLILRNADSDTRTGQARSFESAFT